MRDLIELSSTEAQWGRREQGPSAEPFQGHRALAWWLIPWVIECRPAFSVLFHFLWFPGSPCSHSHSRCPCWPHLP